MRIRLQRSAGSQPRADRPKFGVPSAKSRNLSLFRLFEDVHAAARVAWGGALGVVKVDMDINRLKEFYTGLYHTMLGPVLLSDSDGTYRFGSGNFQDDASKEKFIKHIGTEAFSTFSLWDTFRGVQPLMNLLHPQKSTIAVYFAGRAANTASIFSHSPFD